MWKNMKRNAQARYKLYFGYQKDRQTPRILGGTIRLEIMNKIIQKK